MEKADVIEAQNCTETSKCTLPKLPSTTPNAPSDHVSHDTSALLIAILVKFSLEIKLSHTLFVEHARRAHLLNSAI